VCMYFGYQPTILHGVKSRRHTAVRTTQSACYLEVCERSFDLLYGIVFFSSEFNWRN
jgi:hypothetical protein